MLLSIDYQTYHFTIFYEFIYLTIHDYFLFKTDFCNEYHAGNKLSVYLHEYELQLGHSFKYNVANCPNLTGCNLIFILFSKFHI